jgi:hypothetical protein
MPKHRLVGDGRSGIAVTDVVGILWSWAKCRGRMYVVGILWDKCRGRMYAFVESVVSSGKQYQNGDKNGDRESTNKAATGRAASRSWRRPKDSGGRSNALSVFQFGAAIQTTGQNGNVGT